MVVELLDAIVAMATMRSTRRSVNKAYSCRKWQKRQDAQDTCPAIAQVEQIPFDLNQVVIPTELPPFSFGYFIVEEGTCLLDDNIKKEMTCWSFTWNTSLMMIPGSVSPALAMKKLSIKCRMTPKTKSHQLRYCVSHPIVNQSMLWLFSWFLLEKRKYGREEPGYSERERTWWLICSDICFHESSPLILFPNSCPVGSLPNNDFPL